MGYYTIWLVLVKIFFVPFWELGKGRAALVASIGRDYEGSRKTEDGGVRLAEKMSVGCVI